MFKLGAKSLLLLGKILFFVSIVFTLIGVWIFSNLPTDKDIRSCLTTKMNSVKLCPSSGSYVRLRQISPYFIKSLIVSEDGTFYSHRGFDLYELEKSLQKNIKQKRFARGGSTISQQLAKNLFLTKDKTLRRKLLEAIITVRLENVLSKNEILEKYVNVVEFGPKIYGIKAAANYYFSKSPADLNLTESAFLVFLLPNPKVYSRSFLTKKLTPFARNRLESILDRLLAFSKINITEYEAGLDSLEYFFGGGPILNDENLDLIDEETAPIEDDLDFEL